MTEDTPSWLDETFLTACLHEEGKPEARVLSFKAKPPVSVGNNYGSTMFRVNIYFSRGDDDKIYTKSVIVKAPLIKGVLKELMEESNANDRESIFYADIITKINKELRYQIAPGQYPCPLANILVLEDLKEEGYTMGDRCTQLDFPHCEQFVITLAKYHAATIFLHTKYPQKIETFGEEMYYSRDKPTSNILSLFLPVCFKTFAKAVEKIEGCEKFAEIYRNMADSIWDTMIEMCIPKKFSFNVLNHGDVWTNNILFKHDETGKVVNAKLVDFQGYRYASPTLDLINFIWSSASFEVREYKLQELYNIYLLTLNTTLQELNCPERYSPEDFEKDMNDSRPFVMIMVSGPLSMSICKDPLNIDLMFNVEMLTKIQADINIDTNPFMKIFTTNAFKIKIPQALKQMEQLGLLPD